MNVLDKTISLINAAHGVKLPRWIVPLLVTLFMSLVVVAAVHGAYSLDMQVQALEQAKHDQDILAADRQETLDLALEFGYDPLIVDVARMESRRAFRAKHCECPTWRFVRTDRELAYIILSIIQTESRGNNSAMNPGGPAYGLTQLLLSTAREHDAKVQPAELYGVPKNLHIAVDHFVDLLERYNGNYTLAVIAWNRGAGGIDRSIAIGNSPENGYARKVFAQAALRNARR